MMLPQESRFQMSVDGFKIKENCIETDPRLVLVGNKDDLTDSKIISREEAINLSRKMKVPLFETSAKDNINVEEMFREVAKLMLQQKDEALGRRKSITPK